MLSAVICCKCRTLRPYTIKDHERIATLSDGKQYVYNYTYATCNVCGEKVSVPGLVDLNNAALDKAVAEGNIYIEEDDTEE